MKQTSSKTKDSITGTPDLNRDSNRSPNRRDFSFEEFLHGPEIEKKDPCLILYHALSRSHEEVVPAMLDWYRSGDLWKVTMASTYFQHSNVLETIDDLIRRIQSADDADAREAKMRLSVYGEIAFKRALRELSGPNLQSVMREVFFRMEGRVIGFVLKSLRKESFAVKISAARAINGIRNHHAIPVLVDLLCDIKSTARKLGEESDSQCEWSRTQPVLN
ncbi:MAG: hypothetical protein KC978_21735 [Candidatus Omnitrophica bacterium]|nr:hypothetical protein [Candidatus Omnitrophota bacterium]